MRQSDESKVKTTFIRPVNRTMSYGDRRGYVCICNIKTKKLNNAELSARAWFQPCTDTIRESIGDTSYWRSYVRINHSSTCFLSLSKHVVELCLRLPTRIAKYIQ